MTSAAFLLGSHLQCKPDRRAFRFRLSFSPFCRACATPFLSTYLLLRLYQLSFVLLPFLLPRSLLKLSLVLFTSLILRGSHDSRPTRFRRHPSCSGACVHTVYGACACWRLRLAQADRVDFLSYKPQIISHARPVNCPLFVSHRHLALSSLVLGCHICCRCSRSSAPSSRLTGSSPPDPANRPCELFASALHRRSLRCLLEYTPRSPSKSRAFVVGRP